MDKSLESLTEGTVICKGKEILLGNSWKRQVQNTFRPQPPHIGRRYLAAVIEEPYGIWGFVDERFYLCYTQINAE